MGIAVEFCPDLCLRSFEEYASERRLPEECLPLILVDGIIYNFLKKGQRNYWLMGEIPLRMTRGGGVLSRSLASVRILEATHFLGEKEIWTRGIYEVVEVYDAGDGRIHFDGLEKIE